MENKLKQEKSGKLWSYGAIKQSSLIEIASGDNTNEKLWILWRHVKIKKYKSYNINHIPLTKMSLFFIVSELNLFINTSSFALNVLMAGCTQQNITLHIWFYDKHILLLKNVQSIYSFHFATYTIWHNCNRVKIDILEHNHIYVYTDPSFE